MVPKCPKYLYETITSSEERRMGQAMAMAMGPHGFPFSALPFGGWDYWNLSRCWSHEISSFLMLNCPSFWVQLSSIQNCDVERKRVLKLSYARESWNPHGESSAKVAQKTNRKASSRKLPNKCFFKSDGHVPIHGDVYVSNYKGFLSKFTWKIPLKGPRKPRASSAKARVQISAQIPPPSWW